MDTGSLPARPAPRAFEFWGGVPRIAVYDNLKPAVLEGHNRREHDVFPLPLYLTSQERRFVQ